MDKGPLKRIPLIKPDLPVLEAVRRPFQEILSNGKVTNFGKYVALLEKATQDYLDIPTATVSSGTVGLVLTLQALGLKPGQKVILPSFSFMATAQAVLYAGGRPVFAEIDPDLTLSPSDLEFLLSSHRDAAFVIPVHTYGHPCNAEGIREAIRQSAKRNHTDIRLLYDAAHAFGSEWDGKRVGSFGDAEVFSLSVTKVLVSVEGGLIASRNQPLMDRVKKMRNYGIEDRYDAHGPGLNGKMSEFHAIIGLNNLERLEALLSVRRTKASYYTRRIHEKTCFRAVPVHPKARHTFKDFTVLVPPRLKERRGAIIDFLMGQGIETRAYFYPPIHEQAFFRRFSDRPLPRTEDLSRRVITLPFFTTLSEEEMDSVVAGLRQAQEAFG